MSPKKTVTTSIISTLTSLREHLLSLVKEPKYSQWHNALRFVADNEDAQLLVQEACLKRTLLLEEELLSVCSNVFSRHVFVGSFMFQLDSIPERATNEVITQIFKKTGIRGFLKITIRDQIDSGRAMFVSVDEQALSFEKFHDSPSYFGDLLNKVERIKEELEKFIRDFPWLEKIEKLEEEIRVLREKQPPTFSPGFPGMCSGMGRR